jgi:hypothetical protein
MKILRNFAVCLAILFFLMNYSLKFLCVDCSGYIMLLNYWPLFLVEIIIQASLLLVMYYLSN